MKSRYFTAVVVDQSFQIVRCCFPGGEICVSANNIFLNEGQNTDLHGILVRAIYLKRVESKFKEYALNDIFLSSSLSTNSNRLNGFLVVCRQET